MRFHVGHAHTFETHAHHRLHKLFELFRRRRLAVHVVHYQQCLRWRAALQFLGQRGPVSQRGFQRAVDAGHVRAQQLAFTAVVDAERLFGHHWMPCRNQTAASVSLLNMRIV